ncbi:hypothetical protein ECANGB1_1081 [Enterospora canceri]|uniref:STAS domain-containing protein n=1 Tax=Enterospora canceri TaxID=1081671 RepID=A0A1Y1S6V4_9MICR|nr:hypothetical protein ECANGB1_1081 [Enterospora canceri]
MNIHEIIGEIEQKAATGPVTIDFTECTYIDLSGNIELIDYLGETDTKITVVGDSLNLYSRLKQD